VSKLSRRDENQLIFDLIKGVYGKNVEFTVENVGVIIKQAGLKIENVTPNRISNILRRRVLVLGKVKGTGKRVYKLTK
tara:strand:- start:7933 stop:8166 length:234 start_codon:yes stop_codon:yes gene_type:complete